MRWLIGVFLVWYVQFAFAGEFVVVVSSSSKVGLLDSNKVRDLFLKKRSFSGKQKLIPVNLLGDNEIRAEFERSVLRMRREEINHLWIKDHFLGISPPVTQASLASIRLFVERVDGAIGYLPKDMVNDNLKIVHEF
ncbi:MAG: hypothetical protein JKY88_19770 [Pseudomonadales bacterium]|nr:hypothetical protein [Pseudomonadales bacterium]